MRDSLHSPQYIHKILKVCELGNGDKCIENPKIGDDLCAIGLHCLQGHCENLSIGSNYDSQYDESESEEFYNSDLFDEMMNLLYA